MRRYRSLRLPVVTAAGASRVLQASGKPIFDELGCFRGYRGACSDITEQIIASENLIQAQKMETVGQLTGGIAHDFNNLLAVIVGNLELANQPSTTGPAQRIVIDRAANAAERGAALVQRLLAFSRRRALSPEIVKLPILIGGLLDILESTLGQMTISHSFGNELWPVKVEPSQLETALLNLAINARDAMAGKGELKIEAFNVSINSTASSGSDALAAGDYVAIRVVDTGNGMSSQTIKHIFEPFFTTKEVGRGSGLGLSMVSGFAIQSGGAVTATSIEGAGTTMTMYLPRRHEAVDRSAKDKSPDSPSAQGGHVLLVDDNGSLIEVIVTWLERLGYRVSVAEDANQALDILQQNPDIVVLLTDVILPGGLSDDQLSLQAMDMFPNISVILMSGYVDLSAERLKQFGADFPILHKPFLSDDLGSRLRSVLDRAF